MFEFFKICNIMSIDQSKIEYYLYSSYFNLDLTLVLIVDSQTNSLTNGKNFNNINMTFALC